MMMPRNDARPSGAWPSVVTIGETMALMRADETGPLAQVSGMHLGIGGAESNFAVALRRLGTSVAWTGRVGADSLGDRVVRELTAEGIETLAIQDHLKPTGLMIKERRTAQTQKVWYYRAGNAGSQLTPGDIPVAHVTNAALLHITGISLGLSESAARAVRYAVDVAREHGTVVSFDLNYRAALWSQEAAGAAFRDVIAQADLVFAGDDEATMAVGPASDPHELAKRVADCGPRHAVIKLGEHGCVAQIDGGSFIQEAVPVQAIDTVGAGDGFVAGYVADFLGGADPQTCLRTAVAVGAFACLVPGDWEGMPRRSELALLQAKEPVTR